MKINNLVVHILTKKNEHLMFSQVSNIETCANRLLIESTHDAGVVSADIDLDRIDEVVIQDNKDVNNKKDVDKEKPEELN